MRTAVLLGAIATLAAGSAAFGQPLAGEGETSIYYRPVRGQSADALALVMEVRKELERSHQLQLVETLDATTMQIEAPVEIIPSPDGRTILVSYELTPARADPQAFAVSCRMGKLGDCAEAMVLRAERLARDTARLR